MFDVSLFSRRVIFILCASVFTCAVNGTGAAQDSSATPNRGVETYDAAYFAPYSPISAADMLARVPGADSILSDDSTGDFAAQERRGLRSDTDQILINGNRVTTKGNDIQEYFGRISAAQVIRIEIISGNVREIDADVGSRVINVVLDENMTGGSGTWQAGAQIYDTGQIRPIGFASYSADAGNWSYTVFVETRPNMPNRDLDEVFFTPDGTPFFQSIEKRIVDRQFYIGRGRLAYTFGPDHYIQLNGFVEHKPIKVFESDFTFGFDQLGNRFNSDATFEQRSGKNDDWELSGDYIQPLSKSLQLEALFVLRTDTHQRDNDNFRAFGGPDVLISGDDEDETAKEKILRLTLDWTASPKHSFELGAEGALNSLDVFQNIFTVEDGETIDAGIFNSDQKVSEDRIEIFSTHNWKATDKLEFDTGLAWEFSKLDQVGSDVDVNRTLKFVKPSLDAFYTATDSTRLWFSFKRDVGQLDFEDFVAEVDRNDDEIDLGNPDLEPETSWDFEVGAERRLADNKGLVNGRVFYRRVNDVSDRIPFGDFDTQPGNIGSGSHYGFELESSLRLAQFNLIDAVLGASYLWQDSSVTDAFTGQKRDFALQGEHELSINFRHDIKAWGLSYDIEFSNDGPRLLSEFDRLRRGNPRSNLKLTVEKQVLNDVVLRVIWDNVLKTTNFRRTTVFTPNQGSGNLTSFQERRIVPMVDVGVSLVGRF